MYPSARLRGCTLVVHSRYTGGNVTVPWRYTDGKLLVNWRYTDDTLARILTSDTSCSRVVATRHSSCPSAEGVSGDWMRHKTDFDTLEKRNIFVLYRESNQMTKLFSQ